MVPVAIAAGAALFAGGVAVGKALSGGDEKELTVRTVPESEVPAHIRKKIEQKSREKR